MGEVSATEGPGCIQKIRKMRRVSLMEAVW